MFKNQRLVHLQLHKTYSLFFELFLNGLFLWHMIPASLRLKLFSKLQIKKKEKKRLPKNREKYWNTRWWITGILPLLYLTISYIFWGQKAKHRCFLAQCHIISSMFWFIIGFSKHYIWKISHKLSAKAELLSILYLNIDWC